MKRMLLLMIASSFLISCSFGGKKSSGKPDTRGEVIPKESAKSFEIQRPYGMVAIPGGSFVMGQSDVDFTATPERAPLKTVTVSSFFMDETEVTNAQYREFIKYVRDSIARTLLAEEAGDGSGNGTGISNYAYLSKKAGNNNGLSAYQKFLEAQGDRNGYNETKKLDWKTPLYWNTNQYPDDKYAEVMESMYLPVSKRVNGQRLLDTNKLVYSYEWEDVLTAAKEGKNSMQYLKRENIAVYPDTTVWVKDFNYAYNEPLFDQYFWSKTYKNYPVVGVTWDQARAFCDYKTKAKRDYINSKKKKGDRPMKFRLPTEAEWEYAARGGLENATYPWGGPYLTDDRGCYLANFKPKRGNYIEDDKKGTYPYTAPVKKFHKNGYGLYDMAGNVSEWTESPYSNATYQFSSTLNPYLSNQAYREAKKSVRGGSWKDVGYMLMTGYRDWERKDSARSYIGFRTIQDVPAGTVKLRKTSK